MAGKFPSVINLIPGTFFHEWQRDSRNSDDDGSKRNEEPWKGVVE